MFPDEDGIWMEIAYYDGLNDIYSNISIFLVFGQVYNVKLNRQILQLPFENLI